MRKEEVIYLDYNDLNKEYQNNYRFEDVRWCSFKSSSITKKELLKANLIIYICNENYPRYKIIKSRYF